MAVQFATMEVRYDADNSQEVVVMLWALDNAAALLPPLTACSIQSKLHKVDSTNLCVEEGMTHAQKPCATVSTTFGLS